MLVHTHISPGTLVAYRAPDDRVGHGRDRITVRLETRSDALARRYVSSGYTASNPLGQAHSLEANTAAVFPSTRRFSRRRVTIMPVFPETKEFPADHPIHRGLIMFGRKPQGSSVRPSDSQHREPETVRMCRKLPGSSVRPSSSPPAVLPPSNEPQEGEPAK